MMSRSTLRLTAEDRASAQKARMISARRCSMVIRRAYWRLRLRGVVSWSVVLITVGGVLPGPVALHWLPGPGVAFLGLVEFSSTSDSVAGPPGPPRSQSCGEKA